MHTPIQNIIKQIPNWNPDSVEVIQELSDSITSTSYLLKYSDQKYVLRIDKSFDQGVIPDRKNEAEILKRLDEKALCNKLIYSDLDNGVLLTEYIEAFVWENNDIDNSFNIIELANKLKAIHSLGLSVQSFDLVGGVRRYAETLHTKASENWTNEIVKLLKECTQRPFVLCHNDLHIGNILENKELHFIDWEYAGLGNPLFDVSSILQYHELSNENTELFLNTYFGEITQSTVDDIQRYKSIHAHLLALWLSVLIKSASDKGIHDSKSEEELKLVLKRL